MTLIVFIGLASFVFVLVKAWHWWVGDSTAYREVPSTHVAGPDDQDVDFDAALRSIGGPR